MKLSDLRKEIRSIDDQLIGLMGERIKLAKKVGEHKIENDLPIKDFKVEKEVIERSRSKAKAVGLYEDMAEDVAKIMIQYAVMAQEEFHSRTKRKSAAKKKNVLIVGGLGKMGLWMAQFFDSFGHQIVLCEQRDISPNEMDDYPVTKNLTKAASTADIIILATPISKTAGVIDELSEIDTPALIFDICSLKSPILDSIYQAKKKGRRIVSVHPMFGPEMQLLSGQNILVCNAGDKKLVDETIALFSDTTANVVTVALDKHDNLMSYVLGLSHMLNLAFAKALTDSEFSFAELSAVASSTFNAQLKVVTPVISENQDLYYEIQAENNHSEEIIEGMVTKLQDYLKTVSSKDRELFKQYMETSRAYVWD